MYELPPFEDTFQPMKHNKYLMRRNDVVSRFVPCHAVTRDMSRVQVQHQPGVLPAGRAQAGPGRPEQAHGGEAGRRLHLGPGNIRGLPYRSGHLRSQEIVEIILSCQVFLCRPFFSLSSSPSFFTPTQSTLMREHLPLMGHRHDYVVILITFRPRGSFVMFYSSVICICIDGWCGLKISSFERSGEKRIRIWMTAKMTIIVTTCIIAIHWDKEIKCRAVNAALHCGKGIISKYLIRLFIPQGTLSPFLSVYFSS